jgi:hypothetical protein
MMDSRPPPARRLPCWADATLVDSGERDSGGRTASYGDNGLYRQGYRPCETHYVDAHTREGR